MVCKRLIKKVFFFAILLSLLCSSACFRAARSKLEKGRTNPLTSLWVPLSKPATRAYNHSILRSFRGKSDCQPNCPTVDIWQYQYRDPKTGKMTTSTQPIASKREHWKVPFEARMVAVTLFGDDPKYVTGLENFIASGKSLKKFNNIPTEELWGYDTFIFRIYVPKRNSNSKKMTPIKGELPDAFIQKLLNLGCEIAFVDNGLESTGVDAFFWRFMVAAEKMGPKERIRYLIRDTDWLVTAADAFSVGEWINSGLQFHRVHIVPACMGPIIGMDSGGQHQGAGPFFDLKDYIEKYPYRNFYGDDEMFLRDIMWPRMLYAGSILTHYYKPDFFSYISQPYKDSCQRPTQKFCDDMRPGGICRDEQMPADLNYPYMRLGETKDNKLFLEQKDIFDMHLKDNVRAQKAASGLSLNPLFKF